MHDYFVPSPSLARAFGCCNSILFLTPLLYFLVSGSPIMAKADLRSFKTNFCDTSGTFGRPVCSADIPLVQPIVLSPAGHGRGAVGRNGPESALARAGFSITRTKLGKISWWQGAWPFITCELAVDQCGKGRLSFLYSGDEQRRPTWFR